MSSEHCSLVCLTLSQAICPLGPVTAHQSQASREPPLPYVDATTNIKTSNLASSLSWRVSGPEVLQLLRAQEIKLTPHHPRSPLSTPRVRGHLSSPNVSVTLPQLFPGGAAPGSMASRAFSFCPPWSHPLGLGTPLADPKHPAWSPHHFLSLPPWPCGPLLLQHPCLLSS